MDDELRLLIEVEGVDAIVTIKRCIRGEWVTVGCAAVRTEGTMTIGASWAETAAAADALVAAIHTLRQHGIGAVAGAEAAAREAWAEAHIF